MTISNETNKHMENYVRKFCEEKPNESKSPFKSPHKNIPLLTKFRLLFVKPQYETDESTGWTIMYKVLGFKIYVLKEFQKPTKNTYNCRHKVNSIDQ